MQPILTTAHQNNDNSILVRFINYFIDMLQCHWRVAGQRNPKCKNATVTLAKWVQKLKNNKLSRHKQTVFKLCLPRNIFCWNDSVGCSGGNGCSEGCVGGGTTGTGNRASPDGRKFNGFEERLWDGFKIFDFLFRPLLRCFGTGWFVFDAGFFAWGWDCGLVKCVGFVKWLEDCEL